MLHQIKPIAIKNDTTTAKPASTFISQNLLMGKDCASCFGTGTHITDRGLVRCYVCGGSGRKGE